MVCKASHSFWEQATPSIKIIRGECMKRQIEVLKKSDTLCVMELLVFVQDSSELQNHGVSGKQSRGVLHSANYSIVVGVVHDCVRMKTAGENWRTVTDEEVISISHAEVDLASEGCSLVTIRPFFINIQEDPAEVRNKWNQCDWSARWNANEASSASAEVYIRRVLRVGQVSRFFTHCTCW